MGIENVDRSLKMKPYDDQDPVTHKVKYLVHTGTETIPATGNVITSQLKAWNDTVHMAMLIDLILKRGSEKRGGVFLWMDNSGVHKGSCLDAFIWKEVVFGSKYSSRTPAS